MLAIDRDPDAIAGGQQLVAASGDRLRLMPGRFSSLDMLAAAHAPDGVDGVVLDIGVSSMQLDQAERGFSFRFDGPLDMRMSRDGVSAADLVNHEDETRLADIIYHFGEERRSRRGRARPSSRPAARHRSPRRSMLADIIATVVRAEPRGPASGNTQFPGSAHRAERRALANSSRPCMRPSAA